METDTMEDNALEKDPVCGKKISRDTAHAVVQFKGRQYLVCCPLCKTAFENNPELFVYLENLQRLRAKRD